MSSPSEAGGSAPGRPSRTGGGPTSDPAGAPRAARVAVVGCGATGARAARQLIDSDRVRAIALSGSEQARLDGLRGGLGDRAEVADAIDAGAEVVVLAGPAGTHGAVAADLVAAGASVVSTSDDIADVETLLALHDRAVGAGVTVVAGAAFSPGLTCVLARHGGAWLDTVEEIHVARFGTGGPACARQHHRALSSRARDWRDGELIRRPGGSGRELVTFPDPVGSVDCYRAGLPDALLLHRVHPDAQRITARQAANRRDRMTAWLPMLRRPHPEGKVGAVRVELRGTRDGAYVTEVLGVLDRPAVAAGAVAGVAARWIVDGRLDGPGAFGLGEAVEPVAFLHDLAVAGVRAARFVGY